MKDSKNNWVEIDKITQALIDEYYQTIPPWRFFPMDPLPPPPPTDKSPCQKTTQCASTVAMPQVDVESFLRNNLVGQPQAVDTILPYLETYKAGLAPEGRPAGIFLLLGPTGVGKTHLIELIAEALHGYRSNVLRVDCAEYQQEHEIAKLVGAPPGFVGFKEVAPVFSTAKVSAVVSPACNLSLILLDEIEKVAKSFHNILLGIMDRGIMKTGDGQTTQFERTMIFMTSNLGAKEIQRELLPKMGLNAGDATELTGDFKAKLEQRGMTAVKKHFSPEFVNRLDAVITYQPLGEAELEKILDLHLAEQQRHIVKRLGAQSFNFELTGPARRFLLEKGTSVQYGARELKRVVQKYLMHPLASGFARGKIAPGDTLLVRAHDGKLEYQAMLGKAAA